MRDDEEESKLGAKEKSKLLEAAPPLRAEDEEEEEGKEEGKEEEEEWALAGASVGVEERAGLKDGGIWSWVPILPLPLLLLIILILLPLPLPALLLPLLALLSLLLCISIPKSYLLDAIVPGIMMGEYAEVVSISLTPDPTTGPCNNGDPMLRANEVEEVREEDDEGEDTAVKTCQLEVADGVGE